MKKNKKRRGINDKRHPKLMERQLSGIVMKITTFHMPKINRKKLKTKK